MNTTACFVVTFGERGLHLRVATRIINACKDRNVLLSISRTDCVIPAEAKSITGMLKLGIGPHQEGLVCLEGHPGGIEEVRRMIEASLGTFCRQVPAPEKSP